MRSVTPYYPSGAAGAGLALLRLSVAYWLLLSAYPSEFPIWQQMTIGLFALALALGLQARWLSLICLIFVFERIFSSATTMSLSFQALLSILALALVGPGAFSIDAQLFGRRTVVLSDKTSE